MLRPREIGLSYKATSLSLHDPKLRMQNKDLHQLILNLLLWHIKLFNEDVQGSEWQSREIKGKIPPSQGQGQGEKEEPR